MAVPVLAFNPIGWAVLGAGGFLTYKAGKKAGLKTEEDLDKPCIADRAIKGTMKTMYRAQKGVQESLGKTREKYGAMWQEAQDETNDA